jgi:hypothetical protein
LLAKTHSLSCAKRPAEHLFVYFVVSKIPAALRRRRPYASQMRWLFVGEALVLRKDQRILVFLVLKSLATSHSPRATINKKARHKRAILFVVESVD